MVALSGAPRPDAVVPDVAAPSPPRAKTQSEFARRTARWTSNPVVRCNVYHLGHWGAGLNRALRLGAYHVGVEVFGREYCFGRAQSPDKSGVCELDPRQNPE